MNFIKEITFSDWARILTVSFLVGVLVFLLVLNMFPRHTKCTNSQLHEVILKVEQCTKLNAICNEAAKDKILKEVCK